MTDDSKLKPANIPSALGQLLNLAPFCLSITLLILYARGHLLAEIVYPVGDEAADMLHANQLDQQGYLLTGQYSLFSFHHPGPFFFYIANLCENLLSHIIPTRHGQWVFSILFLNAVFLSIAAHLSFHDTSESPVLKTLKRIVFVLLALVILGNYTISVWPPYKLILPYLAFLATLPLIARREFKYIPLSITLACILIHGRVDQPLFTLPFIFLAYILGRKTQKKPLERTEKRSIFCGLVIALLFSAPIWIDLILNTPSNLSKISNTILRGPSGNNSWSNVFAFLVHYWRSPFGLFYYLFAGIGVTVILIFTSHRNKIIFRQMVIAAFLITILAVLYFKGAPLPLKQYMGTFYFSIPLLLILISICSIIDFIFYRKDGCLPSPLVVIGILLVPTILWGLRASHHLPAKNLEIGELSNAIISQAQTEDWNEVTLDYADHDLWAITAGILLELHRRNTKAVVIQSHMDFLFTSLAVKEGTITPNIRIIKAENCDENCLLKTGNYALDRGPVFKPSDKGFLPIGGRNRFDTDKALFIGWAEGETEHRWNTNKLAEIQFAVEKKISVKGQLTLELISHGEQKVFVSLNGLPLGMKIANSKKGQILTFAFDPSLLKTEDVNTLRFDLPLARRPLNTDSRRLSIGLKSFIIE